MSEEYYVGVDLGGTNIKAGIVTSGARVVAKTSAPTQCEKGADHIVNRIHDIIEDMRQRAKLPREAIRGLGIGSPGTLDIKAGVVHFVVNMPLWREIEVVKRVSEKTGFRVLLENDANAAAYGEYWAGAGRNVTSMVMFTVGTGIGGGIIANGRLIHGDTDCAAELGHMIIESQGRKCDCGNWGCLEAYASGNSLVKRFKEALDAGAESRLAAGVRAGRKITSFEISEAALAGDDLSNRIFAETGVYLGVGIVNVMHIINPACVVISGGLINAGELLMAPIRRTVQERALPDARRNCRIVFATLGEDAGFIGGAGCALAEFGTSR